MVLLDIYFKKEAVDSHLTFFLPNVRNVYQVIKFYVPRILF